MGSSTAAAKQTMKVMAILSAVLTASLQMHLISCRTPNGAGRGNIQCGPGEKNPCADGRQCCSASGRCGISSLECGDGCQSGSCWDMSQFSASSRGNIQCGPREKNPCVDGRQCCSSSGRCGISSLECGDGCQSGSCWDMSQLSASGRGNIQCGPREKNPCVDGRQCCSSSGRCGISSLECGDGCQSGSCWDMSQLRFQDSESAVDQSTLQLDHNSTESKKPNSIATAGHLVTAELFDKIFPHRNAFYTYDAFLVATEAFPEFGTTGASAAQRRDVAAFCAHVHHETAGLTKLAEAAGGTDDESADFCCAEYCLESNPRAKPFSCFPGKKYFARGPLKLTWNYNYGSASEVLGANILAEPELLTEDAVLSFKSALWVWMSAADDKRPSGHEVMAGPWSPSDSDIAANRLPGFGITIDILGGHAECGHESAAATARSQKYFHVAKLLDVSAGPHLECANMLPF